MVGEWQASIAPPQMADWVTIAACLVAAAMSMRAAARGTSAAFERHFWQFAAGLLVLLAINELLDLHTLITIAGRTHAKAFGWYGAHRAAQYAFVIALSGVAAMAGLAILWLTRRADHAVRLAVVGFAFIGLFALLRAASFHHLDDFLGGRTFRIDWSSVPEMVGIGIVASAAAIYPRTPDMDAS
ncbi:hypothetical protein CDQ92_07925 [Sphingopyxis bauzanensis]|uniref:Uncharacterized protein n=1 Tax=Sphingopyxis bauzanensis TaxID=651663 RepID=A0A246JVA4_9SPHN|nr:hypothetical protein CDQ92_07925 [Sphingopyxis bauzanensis]GGJ41907.1 hypothetical protein GCM10011393_10070 [Sphingopyxis bauzanensis]